MIDHKRIAVQWKEFGLPVFFPRAAELDLDMDFIITVTGPRRAGKTYFCFQLMDELLKKGVGRDNILYINFEDEKLLGADAGDLERLLDAFFELFPIDKNQKVYLFLDEIQTVKNWDAWVRRVYDTRKDVQMVITGSSSKMLSGEVSARLRGRVYNKEIYPLSFSEFLSWKNVPYDPKTVSYGKDATTVKKHYAEYLVNGGYPAVTAQNVPKDSVLQGYYESMIFRDVVERHNVKEVKKLKVLAALIFESTAKEMSYNGLAKRLKSAGFDVSKNTIIDYMSYFEDAYLFFQNLKYEYSLTKQLGSIKKVYCIDNGLLNAVSFKFSEDTGKLMENLSYIELKRRGKRIYYHKKKNECDFIVQEKNRIAAAIQVTKELNEDNAQREESGLLEAMETYGLKEGLILTTDQEETKTMGNKKIRIMPIWKWLLLNE